VYKRGGAIMLMVDDIVALAWEDDGSEQGQFSERRASQLQRSAVLVL
jgi:hypothetical protein